MARGWAIASSTAFLVIELKTTRLTGKSLRIARFWRRVSRTCQEIASPSRSGSVARINESADFTASTIALTALVELGWTS